MGAVRPTYYSQDDRTIYSWNRACFTFFHSDILRLYAVLGLILLMLQRLRPRTALILADVFIGSTAILITGKRNSSIHLSVISSSKGHSKPFTFAFSMTSVTFGRELPVLAAMPLRLMLS